MPTRYFLNALRSGEGSLPAPGAGGWQTDTEFLARYAKSIHLDGQLDAGSMAHSVPSVFQRPIQFHAALSRPGDPLHLAVRNEWRGLMAAIGLSHWLGVQFTATPFTVPQIDSKASSFVGNATAGDLHFRTVLRNQLPSRPNADRTGRVSDWEKWFVLRCDDRLLGATSPWTLVYTASRYKAPDSIPWQKNGLLTDPVHYYDPKGTRYSKQPELAILYAWVRDMLDREPTLARNQAWGYPDALTDYSNLLVKLLTAWATDLAPYADKAYKLEQTRQIFPEAPFSSLLSAPILTGEESDIYVETKGGGRVLLFHEHMAPETRVYGSTFAFQVDVAALPASGDEFHTRNGRLIQQPFLVAEKFFFPDFLLHLKLSDDALRPGDCTLPLPPAFFRYFSPEDAGWLSLTQVHEEWTASFHIPLQGKDRKLQIGRVYRRDDVLKLSMDTPALALWPEFYDERWRGNFAAYAAPHSDDLLVRPLFADGTLSPEQAERESDRSEHTHQKEVRLWQTPQPAIGFALSLRKDGLEQPVGLVLRKALRRAQALAADRVWRVSVDFGTSSTTVMVDRNDGRITEMPFGAHLLSLTRSPDRVEEITRNLYPNKEITPPFRTLLYEAAATQFGGDRTPFTLRFTADIDRDFLNKPIADLKWGAQTRGGANPLIAYLAALVRYIFWEARVQGVGKLDLFWSYPTSLPSGARAIMENFWNGVQFSKPHQDMIVDVHAPMSESEAACRALAEADARVRAGVLTVGVDIGGGSTDIAFWSNQQLLDQVSFKLAGNDMLDRSLLNGPTLIEIFEACSNPPVRLGPQGTETVLSRPEIYVSGVLADAQKELDPRNHPLRMHILQGGRENVTPWIELRSMIYLFFTGLCYYIGSQARSFGVSSPEIDVYFGGRGSTLLTWLSSSSDTVKNALEHALRLGLTRGPDDGVAVAFPSSPPRITFNGLPIAYSVRLPKLKTEVARGLLSSERLKLDARAPLPGAIAGETGWRNDKGAPITWNTRLLPDDLSTIQPPPDKNSFESTMIGTFRSEILHEDAGNDLERLNLDAVRLRLIELHGDDVIDLIRKSTEDEYAAQPLFAYELRALMSQYVHAVQNQPGTGA